MTWKNSAERYGSLPMALHWLTLVLLIGVYGVINAHDWAPKDSALRADLKTWHYMLGLSVFVLVAVRLVLRRLNGLAPAIAPPLPAWQERLAQWFHWLLYAFLVAMPLLGWVVLSAKGEVIPFFGLELPALVPPDKALGSRLKELHETIGTAGYYLIGLHAAAALFHHYVQRDNTMLRMLPAQRR